MLRTAQTEKDTVFIQQRAIFYGTSSEEKMILIWMCSLEKKKVDVASSATHLGINRSATQMFDIEGKLSLGRKTAYSLMGAGFHGAGGLKAAKNGHIWSTFVIPKLLYGVECQLLKKKDIESLDFRENV